MGLAGRYLDEERSQAALMLTIFLLRVVPFVHMDPISYVAGLTPLRLWRFVVATFAGITPMSFVLVTLGDRVAASDLDPRLRRAPRDRPRPAAGRRQAALVLAPVALGLAGRGACSPLRKPGMSGRAVEPVVSRACALRHPLSIPTGRSFPAGAATAPPLASADPVNG